MMRAKKFVIVLASVFTIACAAVQSLIGAAPTAAPTVQPAGMPKVETARAAIDKAFADGGVEMLWDLTNEHADEDLSEPGVQRYTVNLDASAVVDTAAGWCAQTSDILEDNLEHYSPILIVNGRALAPGGAPTFEWEVRPGEDPDHPRGQHCKSWEVLLSDWPVGVHTITEGWVLDDVVNDGDSTFSPGEYRYEYTITVSE